ncbi:MAG: hypothetical protein DMG78_32735, partial [Acidobacteria bacterium]
MGLPATPVATNAASNAPTGTGATVANPLGKGASTPTTIAAAPPSANPTTSVSQGATVANPLGLPQNGSSQNASAAPATPQGATVANPLGLAPGQTLQAEPFEEAPETPVTSNDVIAEAPVTNAVAADAIASSAVVAKAIEPEMPAALALRATHPDFRTAFRIKYVAAGTAYLDGGRGAGLAEGMKLVVREKATGSAVAAASGKDEDIVAELEVASVAEASAVTD